jgi:hypothetical protein
LAAFPKLMGTDSKQQHTFIETDSVRYDTFATMNLFLLFLSVLTEKKMCYQVCLSANGEYVSVVDHQ